MKLLLFSLLMAFSAFSQNLLQERLWKIEDRKKSVYLEKGIFHSGDKKGRATLTGIRHSYSASQGYERIVFDFSSNDIPKVYGYLSPTDKTLYLDFFDTTLKEGLAFPGNSKHVKGIDFFPISSDSLSLEMKFNGTVTADVFYLMNKARLVIDIKK